MKKPLIICIVGESGVGKSHLADYITDKLGIQSIPSYTTRLPRENEKIKSTHIHISHEEFDKIRLSDMIAFTEFGGNRYCCTIDQVQETNLYIIDAPGLKWLRQIFSDDFCIKSVRLWAYDEVRLERLKGDVLRMERDKGKFNMLKPEFDYVIDTNHETFVNEAAIKSVINKILSEYGSSEQ